MIKIKCYLNDTWSLIDREVGEKLLNAITWQNKMMNSGA